MGAQEGSLDNRRKPAVSAMLNVSHAQSYADCYWLYVFVYLHGSRTESLYCLRSSGTMSGSLRLSAMSVVEAFLLW